MSGDSYNDALGRTKEAEWRRIIGALQQLVSTRSEWVK